MLPLAALTLDDLVVLDEIADARAVIVERLRAPRRWTGRLRRTAVARAIRGSNSIEGIVVDLDDADASIDDEAPLSADERTYAEIRGYRQALGYVLEMAEDPAFRLDATALRSMHFMMLSHDLSKGPGRYRPGDIHVVDERDGATVYTGPDADEVAGLVDDLVRDLEAHAEVDAMVRAALAHLGLVLIHPFRDGNGRMSRALQTLVLARSGIAHPELASIEEWLGANTDDYYAVLAHTARGRWDPAADTSLWVSFCLRAHHMQAQTVLRRIARTDELYGRLVDELEARRLPERMLDVLYSAALKFRVRRSTYIAQGDVDERTATRDLRALVDAGLLEAVGETRGRHYVRGTRLDEIVGSLAPAERMRDPYPWMRSRLAQPVDWR